MWAAACNAVCYIFTEAVLFRLMYLGLERVSCGAPNSLQLCTAVWSYQHQPLLYLFHRALFCVAGAGCRWCCQDAFQTLILQSVVISSADLHWQEAIVKSWAQPVGIRGI